eukprot:1196268-Prorocentrum_minimum.AAC.3
MPQLVKRTLWTNLFKIGPISGTQPTDESREFRRRSQEVVAQGRKWKRRARRSPARLGRRCGGGGRAFRTGRTLRTSYGRGRRGGPPPPVAPAPAPPVTSNGPRVTCHIARPTEGA